MFYFDETSSVSFVVHGQHSYLNERWPVGVCCQDVEIKEEGARHTLTLFCCRMDMAGSVDFSAANAKSSAHLKVKGDKKNHRRLVKSGRHFSWSTVLRSSFFSFRIGMPYVRIVSYVFMLFVESPDFISAILSQSNRCWWRLLKSHTSREIKPTFSCFF